MGTDRFSDDAIRRQIALLNRTWYVGAELDGVRWRHFEANLHSLLDAGAQLVLFDAPVHPVVLERIAGTPSAAVHELFRDRLWDLARRLGVPLLHYDDRWYADLSPNEVFDDVIHLSVAGSRIVSRRIADDLRAMMESGVIDSARGTKTASFAHGAAPGTNSR